MLLYALLYAKVGFLEAEHNYLLSKITLRHKIIQRMILDYVTMVHWSVFTGEGLNSLQLFTVYYNLI
jgi:hypothetical protein